MPAPVNNNIPNTESAQQQQLAFLKQAMKTLFELEEKAEIYGMRSVSTCLYLADLLLQQEYELALRHTSGGKNV